MSRFDEIRKYCKHLAANYAERDRMYQGMEQMYNLVWPERDALESALQTIKITLDPDPANAITGAHRLLTVTEPSVKIPRDKNNSATAEVSGRLEKAGLAMLRASGRAGNRPIHYDAALSGVLYSEVQIAVKRTKDLYEQTEGASPAARHRAKRISERTPYLYEVYNPRMGHPVWDNLGLREYHIQQTVTVQAIIDDWGDDAKRVLQGMGKDIDEDRNDIVTVHEFWELSDRTVWIEEGDTPVFSGAHEVPFIPIAAVITEGSNLFALPEQQRRPMLYNDWITGMWSRRNLIYTAAFTNIANLGLSPTFAYRPSGTNDRGPTLKQLGLMQYLQAGGEFAPLATKGVIDPQVLEMLNRAQQKGEESTIYKSALGGFLGSGSTYSTHALLSQLGRLPLETVRRMVGWGLGDAVRMSFEWMRAVPSDYVVRERGVAHEIAAEEIPEFLEVEVGLDVALPQDRLQMANVINQLKSEFPMRWLAEEIMGVEQYEEMQDELMTEQATKVYYGQYVQQMAVKMQQAAQQAEMQARKQAAPMPGNAASLTQEAPGVAPEMAAGGMQGPMQLQTPQTEGEIPL